MGQITPPFSGKYRPQCRFVDSRQWVHLMTLAEALQIRALSGAESFRQKT
jgi:hypothetical protein